jgi:cation transport ATPase
MDEEIQELKDEEKEQAGQPRRRRERSESSNWIVGVVFITLGLLFLLSNVLDVSFVTNWWAVFILIPALYSLNRAWQSYRQHGRLTSRGRSSLVGGLLVLTVALIFLLNLDWGIVWPVFIIIVGLGILLQAAAR